MLPRLLKRVALGHVLVDMTLSSIVHEVFLVS